MPTTSTESACRILGALQGAGIEFAVLHGEERLSSRGSLGDIDVVTREPAGHVLARLARGVDPEDSSLVMHWEYDQGAVSSFWMNRTGRDGVQLDILHDPSGQARYGIRTDVALDCAAEGKQFPRLRQDHEMLYLGVKRYRKQQWAALAQLQPSLQGALESGASVLSRRGRQQFDGALAGRPAANHRLRVERAREYASRRILRRVVHPVGIVALLSSSTRRELEQISTGLTRVLVGVIVLDSNSSRDQLRARKSRFRPHVVLERHPYLRPDLTVEGRLQVDHPAQLIDAMRLLEADRLKRFR